MDSGKICTSSAFWLPSGCGIAALPRYEPCLMSDSEAFSTPTTCTLPVSAIWRSAPSLDFIDSVLPSSFSIVPRTLKLCCARPRRPRWLLRAWPQPRSAISGSCHSSRNWCAPAPCGRAPALFPTCADFSHGWLNVAATDRDCGGLVGAVLLFRRIVDENREAGFHLVLAGGRIGHDRRRRRHDDLLLAVLVLHHQHLAVGRGDGRFNVGIGHGAAGLQIPRPMTFARAAHRLGKDMHFQCLLAAVGLRHAGHADI